MGVHAINWAFRQIEMRDLKLSERVILLTLAHMHHDKTEQCTPSVETIAKKSGLSERRVQMNIRTLGEKHLIAVLKRSKGGFQLSNQYVLLGVTKKAPPKNSRGATGGTPDKEVTRDPDFDDGNIYLPSQEKKKLGL